jgi:hypothetical protein
VIADMTIEGISPRVQRWAILTGPGMIVVFFIGFVISGFFPPPSPMASAQQIADMYSGHTTAIRVGCFVMMFGLGLMAPWGAVLAGQTRRLEGTNPFLAYGQLVCCAIAVIVVELIAMTWAAASFRPDDTSADVTRALNDYGWFLFLYTWPPFSIWCVLVATAILSDKSATPMYPRWLGFLSIFVAVDIVPAGLMNFFKQGPFAFNGALTFYMPLGMFFVWICIMTVTMLRAVNHQISAPATRPADIVTAA